MKIGDKVRIKSDHYKDNDGAVGVIVVVGGELHECTWGIVFKYAFDGGHGLSDRCKYGCGRWYRKSKLKLFKPKPMTPRESVMF